MPSLLAFTLLLVTQYLILQVMESHARAYMLEFEVFARRGGADREKLFLEIGMLAYTQLGGYDSPIPWLRRVGLTKNMYWPVSDRDVQLMSDRLGISTEDLLPLVNLQRASATRTLRVIIQLMLGWFLLSVMIDAIW